MINAFRIGVVGDTKIKGDITLETNESEENAIAASTQFHELLNKQIRDIFHPERVEQRSMLYDENGKLIRTDSNKHLFE